MNNAEYLSLYRQLLRRTSLQTIAVTGPPVPDLQYRSNEVDLQNTSDIIPDKCSVTETDRDGTNEKEEKRGKISTFAPTRLDEPPSCDLTLMTRRNRATLPWNKVRNTEQKEVAGNREDHNFILFHVDAI